VSTLPASSSKTAAVHSCGHAERRNCGFALVAQADFTEAKNCPREIRHAKDFKKIPSSARKLRRHPRGLHLICLAASVYLAR